MPRRVCRWCVTAALLVAPPALAEEKPVTPETLAVLNAAAGNASCLIEANRIIKLSSQVQGTLSDVSVRRGDRVRKGQVVASLDSEVEAAQVESLRLKAGNEALIASKRAVKATLKDTLDRQQTLNKRGAASLQQMQKAEMDYVLANADVEQALLDQQLARIDLKRAEAALVRRNLRAPVDGVVTQVALDPGEFADPQQMAMEIAETAVLRVELYLPLEAFPLVKVGMAATIAPEAPIGGAYPATITSKDGQIDSASGLFQVQFELANPDGVVPGGIRCTARFEPAKN
ncbi:efflux RND transporter periplasmic adaptor subunit [Rhizobium sp. SG2393]|uniref:efflux RND transporter periplasmic adaptor subunit n=1 Tax=Rhizobium sp. SG2393 TaxID=3276279 RepID=UPI00366E0347